MFWRCDATPLSRLYKKEEVEKNQREEEVHLPCEEGLQLGDEVLEINMKSKRSVWITHLIIIEVMTSSKEVKFSPMPGFFL